MAWGRFLLVQDSVRGAGWQKAQTSSKLDRQTAANILRIL